MHAVLALGLLLFAPGQAQAAGASACAERLSIEASADDSGELRAALRQGLLGNSETSLCDEARVRLTRTSAGWNVRLMLRGQQVERDVATVGAAATWVEAWLLPRLAEAPGAEPAEPRAAEERHRQPPPREGKPRTTSTERQGARSSGRAPSPPSTSPSPEVQVVALGSVLAGEDESLWVGGELALRVRVARSAWLGAALGAATDSALSGPAEEYPTTTRQSVLASVRGGALIPISRRVEVAVGGGAGVTTGITVRNADGLSDDIDQGGIFGEILIDSSFALAGGLRLIAGLGARYRLLSTGDPDKTVPLRIPDVMPALSGEFRLGAGYNFGGAP